MSNRTNQKLINFHSSGSSNVPLSDLNYGEIAVRHRTNPGESQLIIKTSNNTSAIFVESAGVVSMINQSIAGVAGNVTEIAQSLSAVSATAVSTQQALAEHIVDNGNFYAEVRNNLSASVVSDINNLANNYYTKTEVDTMTGNLNTNITEVGGRVTSVSGAVEALSGAVYNKYATKDLVATVSANAVTSARTYTDSKITALSGNVVSEFGNYYDKSDVNTMTGNLNTNITEVGGRVTSLSGATEALSGAVVTMSGNVKSYIDDKLSVVYKFRGSVPTYSDLTAITDKQNGDVYNVEAAQGTMGEPGYVPAGTNYAWNETGNTWDALGGTIDLSVYATSADTANLQQEINGLGGNLNNLSGHVQNMTTNYATTAQVATASANAVTSAINYTNSVSANIATTLVNDYYNKSDVNTMTGNLNTNITEVGGRVTSVSGAVEALSGAVYNKYATKDYVNQVSGDAITIAKNYTNTVSGNIASTLINNYYTTGQVENKLTEISNDITAVGGRVTSVSGAVEALSAQTKVIETKANNALNEFKLGTVSTAKSTQSGAKATYTAGGAGILDLTSLVIDCGSW